jgi:hypothetical protein
MEGSCEQCNVPLGSIKFFDQLSSYQLLKMDIIQCNGWMVYTFGCTDNLIGRKEYNLLVG